MAATPDLICTRKLKKLKLRVKSLVGLPGCKICERRTLERTRNHFLDMNEAELNTDEEMED